MAEMTIGNHVAVLRPIKVDGLALDKDSSGKKERYVNAKGEELVKVQLQKAEYAWRNAVTGQEESGTAFKSLNGKPIKPFSKTKAVAQSEITQVMPESMWQYAECDKAYHVVCATLKEQLRESGMALSFKYVNAGFKVYRAFVYFDGVLDRLVMRCCRGDMSKMDLSEEVGAPVEVKGSDDGVDSMDMSAIEV